MFVTYLLDDPQFYFMAIVVVVVSITLHEMAHGVSAIRLGDDTPIRSGHMTLNPLVHMGPFSLLALFLAGIAWGQMPIDPSRMRGKYAEAQVAFAGPATNLGLAIICLTALGLWIRFQPEVTHHAAENARLLLQIAGTLNILLFIFNMMPVVPLDGSRILANFHDGYARWVGDPSNQGVMFFLFIIAFISARWIYGRIQQVAFLYIDLIAG